MSSEVPQAVIAEYVHIPEALVKHGGGQVDIHPALPIPPPNKEAENLSFGQRQAASPHQSAERYGSGAQGNRNLIFPQLGIEVATSERRQLGEVRKKRVLSNGGQPCRDGDGEIWQWSGRGKHIGQSALWEKGPEWVGIMAVTEVDKALQQHWRGDFLRLLTKGGHDVLRRLADADHVIQPASELTRSALQQGQKAGGVAMAQACLHVAVEGGEREIVPQ